MKIIGSKSSAGEDGGLIHISLFLIMFTFAKCNIRTYNVDLGVLGAS